MNNKIKEIYLSNLEWTKTHDNIGGVMCHLIFKDNMPYEEYEMLLKSGYFVLCNKDYITNLQQENERLKEDKAYAIGYIKDNYGKFTEIEIEKDAIKEKRYLNNFNIEHLLNILQNGDGHNE